MLDLVQEEERVAHLTGLGFEELLDALDALEPADLSERYVEISDSYMVLAGKGRPSPEEAVSLDRLDSALRMLLTEKGLLVLAGRLLHIHRAAYLGALVFAQDKPRTKALLGIQQSLARASRLADEGLRGPVPVDAAGIADRARQASAAAASLVHLRAGGGWLTGWSNRAQAAEEGLSRLLAELASRDADQSAWEAVETVFDPQCGATELIRRLSACRKTAGWAGCAEILQTTGVRIMDLAGLVKEGLGA